MPFDDAPHDRQARGRCPAGRAASGLDDRKNSVPSRATSSAEIPMPSSRQVKTTWPPSTGRGSTIDGAALGGVLHRVADQVGAEPVQLVGVAERRGPARSGSSTRRSMPLLLGGEPDQVDDVVDDPAQVDRAGDDRVVRVADLREQQQVVDHLAPSAARRAPSRRASPSVVPERSGEDSSISRWPSTDDERVLQLVRDGGDQLALVGVELLELLDQLVLALEGAGVEDRPAEVVADVERRRRLGLGPLAARRAARVSTRLPTHSGPAPSGMKSSDSTPIVPQEGEDQLALLRGRSAVGTAGPGATIATCWMRQASRAAASAIGTRSGPSSTSVPSAE